MKRKNKIRILKELRNISVLAKTCDKCVSSEKNTKLENVMIPTLRK